MLLHRAPSSPLATSHVNMIASVRDFEFHLLSVPFEYLQISAWRTGVCRMFLCRVSFVEKLSQRSPSKQSNKYSSRLSAFMCASGSRSSFDRRLCGRQLRRRLNRCRHLMLRSSRITARRKLRTPAYVRVRILFVCIPFCVSLLICIRRLVRWRLLSLSSSEQEETEDYEGDESGDPDAGTDACFRAGTEAA
jgi:hypothetical protein